ncbi:MAG: hypothetical protein ABI863_19045 [Ginsengibacter sp.]
MKLRIKGNSLRVRLTKPEVSMLAEVGYLEEQTLFAGNKLVYALQCMNNGTELSATFDTNKITMYVHNKLIKDWPQNNVVGFTASMPVSENDTLHLLLEKDFVCLDEITEDQSDHYENPNKTC